MRCDDHRMSIWNGDIPKRLVGLEEVVCMEWRHTQVAGGARGGGLQ
jgi:hypothetical protein